MSRASLVNNFLARSHRRGVLLFVMIFVLLGGSLYAFAQVIVDDSAKVGVGTASPSSKFHIAGDSGLGGSDAAAIRMQDTRSTTPHTYRMAVDGDSFFVTDLTAGTAAHRMWINASGNVGIGTTNPVSGSGSVALHIKGTNPDLRLERSSTGRVWEIENNEYFYIYDRTAGVNRFSINTAGNVGIGTTSPSSRLDVVGGCITGSMCSDARLKDNIRPLPAGTSYLKKVLGLRGVSFQWKDRPHLGQQIGLIAQEVEQVLPEAVTTPEGETAQKGLSCTALDAAIVEAMKEQQAALNAQQDEIRALRQDLAVLKRTQPLSLIAHPSL